VSYVECHTLSTGRDQIGGLQIPECRSKDAVQLVVIVGGVMMEGHKMLHTTQVRKSERVPDAAMTKTDAIRVFFFGVLRVVDE